MEAKAITPTPSAGASVRLQRLEELLGVSPDVLGNPGRGVLGKLATVDEKVDTLTTKVDELVEVMTRRRAVGMFLLKVAAVPFVGVFVVWLLHWLGGFHR